MAWWLAHHPSAVAGSIPAFSTSLFHVGPQVLGEVADKMTGTFVPYRRIKPVLIVSI